MYHNVQAERDEKKEFYNFQAEYRVNNKDLQGQKRPVSYSQLPHITNVSQIKKYPLGKDQIQGSVRETWPKN